MRIRLVILSLLLSLSACATPRIFYLDWLPQYGKKWESAQSGLPVIWPYLFNNGKTDEMLYYTSKLATSGCNKLGDVQWTLELDTPKDSNTAGRAISTYKQIQGLEQQMLSDAAAKGANHFHYGERSLRSFYCARKKQTIYAYQGYANLYACKNKPALPVSCRDLRAHLVTTFPKNKNQIYYANVKPYKPGATKALTLNAAQFISKQFTMAWVSMLRTCEQTLGNIQGCKQGVPAKAMNQWIENGEWCGPIGDQSRPKMPMDYSGRC